MQETTLDATQSTVMPMFGTAHLLPIGLLILFVVFLVYLKKSSASQRSLDLIGDGLAWTLFFCFPVFVTLQVLDGTITWDTALPLYPCPASSLIAPLLVRTKNSTFFNIIFYWVFAGTVQAVITPEIKNTFPHYEYFYFWVCHAGLLALLAYMLIIKEAQPTLRGILPAFIVCNVLVSISAVTNVLLGTNYYYLSMKPSVPTVIDYLGPWPWYIVGMETVGLVQFFLSFALFWFVKNKLLGQNSPKNV